MNVDYFKALHIIFVVTWFAGLFYIVRLFIYHVEALSKPENEKKVLIDQFLIMERRLWYGITWPSAILTGVFGLSLIHQFMPITIHQWLIYKLAFVFGLYCYHLYCGKILKDLKNNRCKLSSTKLRIINEIATIFLISIVFLVILKSTISMIWGLVGLLTTMTVLFSAIKFYKTLREKNERKKY